MSKRHDVQRALATLAVAALAAMTSACDLEVKNPGAILEEDLNTPELMEVLAVGVSTELTDAVDTHDWTVARLVDEAVGSGSYGSTADLRRGIMTSDDSDGEWAQMHEAAWAADTAIVRMTDVLGTEHETFPELVSRMYVIEGVAYNMLGENFCRVVFDGGSAEDKSAAFQLAITAFQNAIAAAGSDPDAEEHITAAHGGIAQAYVGLEMWPEAAQEAGNVPTDFADFAFFDINDEVNEVYVETHERPEFTAWHTLADAVSDDSDEVPNDMYIALIDTGPGQDPRAEFTICGFFDPAEGINLATERCGHHQGADGFAPHYRQERYPTQNTDRPVISGVEMRLIEAEAALEAGDLQGFTDGINAVRDHYGLDNIAVPATVGDFDGFFTDMDASSILDRERWLTLWLQGRRMWDLHRWDHPFIQGGALTDQYLVENPRASCYPIPEDECERNPNVTCT